MPALPARCWSRPESSGLRRSKTPLSLLVPTVPRGNSIVPDESRRSGTRPERAVGDRGRTDRVRPVAVDSKMPSYWRDSSLCLSVSRSTALESGVSLRAVGMNARLETFSRRGCRLGLGPGPLRNGFDCRVIRLGLGPGPLRNGFDCEGNPRRARPSTDPVRQPSSVPPP